MKIKKLKKKCYSEKNPTKLSWLIIAKSDKKNFIKNEKNTKLPWPMSYQALYIMK